jgi:hypothetical protein
VPPAPDLVRVVFGALDVRAWNFKAAPQRPQLIEALDVEDDAIAEYVDAHHAPGL